MTVKVEVRSNGEELYLEVRNNFDFEDARKLLSLCRQAYIPAMQKVVVELVGVRVMRSCSLGALLVLSGYARGVHLAVCLTDCSEDIGYWFNAGLLGSHFSVEKAPGGECLDTAHTRPASHPSPEVPERAKPYHNHCSRCIQPPWVTCFRNCGYSPLDTLLRPA